MAHVYTHVIDNVYCTCILYTDYYSPFEYLFKINIAKLGTTKICYNLLFLHTNKVNINCLTYHICMVCALHWSFTLHPS